MRPEGVKEAWVSFLQGCNAEELAALKAAGVNLDEPTNPNPPQGPNRWIGDDKWINQHAVKPDEPEPADENKDQMISVIAKVIDAFDCSKSKQVKLHADCMRMALGVPGFKSMGQLASKYGTSKAMISWRVKHIQKRVGLEPSFYMRSEKLCKTYSEARKRR